MALNPEFDAFFVANPRVPNLHFKRTSDMATIQAIWKEQKEAGTEIETKFHETPGIEMSLDQDPRWLETLVNGSDKYLKKFVLEESGQPTGLAAFLVHPSALRISLSDWTFFSRFIKRYTMFAPPLLDPCINLEESKYLQSLFERLYRQLGSNEAIFLQSVNIDSPLSQLLSKESPLQKHFHIFEYGERYAHRFINFTGDYDHYLKQLSSNSRSDLKRTRKRFLTEIKTYETKCFRSPNEISTFLDAAMSVSAHTYQYKLLHGGLRDRTFLEKKLNTTAELGWFRSYILFANKQPIAFQVGHLYKGCYHAQEIGYLPDWSKLQVGIFLHTEIIRDLLSTPDEVKRFDFGNDDNLHKQRLSNTATNECYVYLVPRNWRNNLTVFTMLIVNRLSITIGRFLEKNNLRKRIRKILWKLGGANH